MTESIQFEAPDGGWGILVCIGMALPFISGLGSLPSFGLVFGNFLNSVGAGTSAISFISGAFFCSLSFAGLFSGSLFQLYGVRKVGLTGAVLYTLGSVLQIFVSSTTHVLFAYSLLQGFGFGLMIPTCYTTFNNYFVKKRVVWMSFAQTLIGLGCMLYPLAMEKLLEVYGFRGCLLMLAGFNANTIMGMLLMQPVEWHLRRVRIPEELQQMQPETALPMKVAIVLNEAVAVDSTTKLDTNHLSPPATLANSRRNSRKLSREELKMLSSRNSSITSLGNWSGAIVVSDASPEMQHTSHSKRDSVSSAVGDSLVVQPSCWRVIVDFLDLTILKQPVYVNIVLGMSFALYSDVAFFTMQPLYLFESNFDMTQTATIIATGAAADLFSRICLAFMAMCIQIPSRYIYLAGAFFTVIIRFAFLYAHDYLSILIITGVLGFLRTWIHVPLPLVFAEYLPKERFGKAYGLFMFLQGNIMFAISPAVGLIRDVTKDYTLTFHILNFFMALCAIPWLIEVIYVKLKRNNKNAAVNGIA